MTKMRVVLPVLVIAMLCCAAAPASADAASYEMTRETNTRYLRGEHRLKLHLEFTVKQHRITRIKYFVPLRCRDDSGDGPYGSYDYSDIGRRIPIRRGGRFRFRFAGTQSPGLDYYFTSFVGRVYEERIRGRLAFRESAESFKCASGARWDDPWVKFVARRH